MIQAPAPALILASQSAARQSLLRAAGLRFEAMPAAVDEDALKASAQAEQLRAEDAAVMLADAKAARIARRHPDALVIGADPLLLCEGQWFDKPADAAAVAGHLRALSGRTHHLVNGVVAHRHGQRVWQHAGRCALTMRPLSEEFIAAYVAAEGEAARHSVGGYRLEGPGMHLFTRIEGEHSAILGLPMLPLLAFLRHHAVLAD